MRRFLFTGEVYELSDPVAEGFVYALDHRIVDALSGVELCAKAFVAPFPLPLARTQCFVDVVCFIVGFGGLYLPWLHCEVKANTIMHLPADCISESCLVQKLIRCVVSLTLRHFK